MSQRDKSLVLHDRSGRGGHKSGGKTKIPTIFVRSGCTSPVIVMEWRFGRADRARLATVGCFLCPPQVQSFGREPVKVIAASSFIACLPAEMQALNRATRRSTRNTDRNTTPDVSILASAHSSSADTPAQNFLVNLTPPTASLIFWTLVCT